MCIETSILFRICACLGCSSFRNPKKHHWLTTGWISVRFGQSRVALNHDIQYSTDTGKHHRQTDRQTDRIDVSSVNLQHRNCGQGMPSLLSLSSFINRVMSVVLVTLSCHKTDSGCCRIPLWLSRFSLPGGVSMYGLGSGPIRYRVFKGWQYFFLRPPMLYMIVWCGAPKIAKLVYKFNNYCIVYGTQTQITIFVGVYVHQLSYRSGAPQCMMVHHCAWYMIAHIGGGSLHHFLGNLFHDQWMVGWEHPYFTCLEVYGKWCFPY